MIKEKTLILIKPDGVQRNLIGEVILRLERTGFKIVGLDFQIPSVEKVRGHYTLHPEWMGNVGRKLIESKVGAGHDDWEEKDSLKVGEIILDRLVSYMVSGPVVLIVVEGVHAAEIVRKIVGSTEPRVSDVGTIRGDYVIDSFELAEKDQRAVRNLIHASGSAQEAEEEIKHWFGESGVVEYNHVQEQILYSNI